MLRSRTNPLFCLKKKQSDIEREREKDSGRCSISEIKTIIIHHQTKTVFNHLTKPSTFQLTPFFKIKTCAGLLYCLSLARSFASEKIAGFFWFLALNPFIHTHIHTCANLVLFLCLMLHEIENLQRLYFAFFCSFSCNSSVLVCFIFTSLISFKYLIFPEGFSCFWQIKTFFYFLSAYNNQLSVLSFMTTQVVFLFREFCNKV